MDAHKRVFGLKSITIGDIAGDGGMGTTLTELIGDTVPGSALLENTDSTYEDIFSLEQSIAIESIKTAEGSWILHFNTYNTSEEVFALLYGGTVSGTGATKKWASATSIPIVEKSVKIETVGGAIFSMPRVSLRGKATLNFDKGGLGIIEITGAVLQPTKANTAAMERTVSA